LFGMSRMENPRREFGFRKAKFNEI
jgi:hypothetical protein